MQKKLVYSKDIVAKYNISYSTLTYYTNLGIFTVVEKRGNRKLFDEQKVGERLKQIRAMINEGYPLRLICKKLEKRRHFP